MTPLVECVPNFSDGRRTRVVDAIESALCSVDGVWILDRHMDPDHNRSVITLAGRPESLPDALVAAVRVAAERIDLRSHDGEHPRTGATDVIPFVPLRNVSMEECVRLGRDLGARIARELEIPVYLYGWAAQVPGRRKLERIRKIGFERLSEAMSVREVLRPDFVPTRAHPGAGATFIGARKVLIAFNVNLKTDDVRLARTIASKIRESGGGLVGVKALGVYMKKTRTAQVSMNLTDYERTGIQRVFEAIHSMAKDAGVSILGGELVGLAPAPALDCMDPRTLQQIGLDPRSTLDARLAGAGL